MQGDTDLKLFLNATDIMSILDVKRSTAYNIISELNQRLHDMGYDTIPGKVNRRFFEKCYLFSE